MPGLKEGEKQKFTLSRETMDGLKITGMYMYTTNTDITLLVLLYFMFYTCS